MPEEPFLMSKDLSGESRNFSASLFGKFWILLFHIAELSLSFYIRFEDNEVKRYIQEFPYKIVNRYGKPYVQVQLKYNDTRIFSPEDISAMIIVNQKVKAEKFIGKKIKAAVVTVPSWWVHFNIFNIIWLYIYLSVDR